MGSLADGLKLNFHVDSTINRVPDQLFSDPASRHVDFSGLSVLSIYQVQNLCAAAVPVVLLFPCFLHFSIFFELRFWALSRIFP
jgi:hypothetical protein